MGTAQEKCLPGWTCGRLKRINLVHKQQNPNRDYKLFDCMMASIQEHL